MKKILKIGVKDPVVVLASEIVYGQRKEWCDATYRQLKMSLLRPRSFFPYDDKKTRLPVIVWICGGGFTEVDRNVWMPEMAWFTKRGFAVA
ncbi:MAG: hypothetical protein LBS06_07695, partial [Treponema sp.]|nr:hypothetical protein [Treponema sp.]